MITMLKSNNTHKYLLTLIGLTYIFYYIWFRFIRERLPRDIPFELSILGFSGLCIICVTYIYILYRYLKPKVPHPIVLQIVRQVFKLLKPLYTLDELLQQNRYYKRIYHEILHIIVKHVNKLTQSIPIINKYSKNEYDEYLDPQYDFNFNVKSKIFPKVFMLVIFAIDIFYFHKLDYFYICIIFGVYFLFWRYLYFSAAKILENTINFVENYYFVYVLPQDKDIEKGYNEPRGRLESATAYYGYRDYYEDDNYFFDSQIGTYNWDYDYYDRIGLTNVRYFVDSQTDAFYFDYTPFIYTCIERPKVRKEFCKKHNIKSLRIFVTQDDPPFDDISKELAKDFHKLMPFAIDLSVFLRRKDRDKHEDIKKLEMLIIFGYLLCWSYILIVSLHTLNVLDIINLLENTYKYVEEPF